MAAGLKRHADALIEASHACPDRVEADQRLLAAMLGERDSQPNA